MPVGSQMNPLHTVPLYFLKARFNSIIPSTVSSFKRLLSFRFLNQNSTRTSLLPISMFYFIKHNKNKAGNRVLRRRVTIKNMYWNNTTCRAVLTRCLPKTKPVYELPSHLSNARFQLQSSNWEVDPSKQMYRRSWMWSLEFGKKSACQEQRNGIHEFCTHFICLVYFRITSRGIQICYIIFASSTEYLVL